MDPRWLEILKASIWQLAAVSFALGLFWFAMRKELILQIDSPWAVYGVPFGSLLCACLALSSLAEFPTDKVRGYLAAVRNKRNTKLMEKSERQALRKYIPFMTETEKQILGWLITHNQKTFVAQMDGDLASTLYHRGIVRSAVQKGQAFSQTATTFVVPDHLWDILQDNAEQFPSRFNRKERRPWHSPF